MRPDVVMRAHQPTAPPQPITEGQRVGPESSSTTRVFYGNLEALRGIAALAVAFGHCFLIPQFPKGVNAAFQMTLCVMNGHAAVSVFFVLSGFVLTLAMRRSTGSRVSDYIAFEIRRFFRIPPTFLIVACAIAFCATVLLPIHFPDWSSTWFHSTYAKKPSASEIARHLTLLDTKLNPVSWTLQVEMFASLCLPFMIWANRKLPIVGKLVVQLPMLVLAYIFRDINLHPYAYCLAFLWPFYLGVLVVDLGPWLWKRFSSTLGWWLITMGWGVLLCSRLISREIVGRVCEQFGAFIIVGGLVYGPPNWVGKVLDHPFSKFYGRISYCFYLSHFVVMYSVAILLGNFLQSEWILKNPFSFALLIGVISTGIATLPAWLLHVAVEQPCIRISKKISERWFLTRASAAN